MCIKFKNQYIFINNTKINIYVSISRSQYIWLIYHQHKIDMFPKHHRNIDLVPVIYVPQCLIIWESAHRSSSVDLMFHDHALNYEIRYHTYNETRTLILSRLIISIQLWFKFCVRCVFEISISKLLVNFMYYYFINYNYLSFNIWFSMFFSLGIL